MYIFNKITNLILTIYYKFNKDAYRIKVWENAGKEGSPPHVIKRRSIHEIRKKYKTDVFIETGTFMGDMIYSMRNDFQKLFSIELDTDLYKAARNRFEKYNHITIIQGDSGQVLSDILKNMNQKCLFWLDGHYSGGITGKGDLVTPILKELNSIKNNRQKFNNNHIMLIDDARLFNGTDDYPLLEDLKKVCLEYFPDYQFHVKDDIIRLTP